MAFNFVKSLWLGSSTSPSAEERDNPCAACNACEHVTPGSVTPHNLHVLVRLPPPDGTPENQNGHLWWPEKVDSHPAIVAINQAISAAGEAIKGPVKVTAFDYPASLNIPPQAEGSHDVLIFPAAVTMKNVPLHELAELVIHSLMLVRTSDPKPAEKEEKLQGMALLVCCHGSRDVRCGYLGPLLADKLQELGAQVFLSSHIGGHQYAGNVIAYGSRQPSAGTWFGGLSAESATEFYQVLTSLPLSGDPAADEKLRKWWRGRVGLTKEEQAKHFRRCGKHLGDIEDA